MPSYLDTLNQILSLGTVVMQVVVLLVLAGIIFYKAKDHKILSFFRTYAFHFGFLISLASMMLSLFYSNIIGFPPCELCWIQRIFIYPQVIILGMGLLKKDKSIVDYSAALAFIGSLVSLYHIYVEHGGSSALGCANPDVVNQVSCATRYVYEFGYVSIPVMAFTAQIFILILLLDYRFISGKHTK